MRKLLIIAGLIFTITSCDVLNQMGEIKRFAECDFTISTVKVEKLGGINISNYNDPDDLNFSDMMILGQKLVSGSLEAKMKVTINALNKDVKKASISGVEWQLFMKDIQYSNGRIEEYVEVLPGTSTDFNVDVSFDMLKVLKSEKLGTILSMVLDGNNSHNLQELELAVKVKPYYTSNGKLHEYPGFITIRP